MLFRVRIRNGRHAKRRLNRIPCAVLLLTLLCRRGGGGTAPRVDGRFVGCGCLFTDEDEDDSRGVTPLLLCVHYYSLTLRAGARAPAGVVSVCTNVGTESTVTHIRTGADHITRTEMRQPSARDAIANIVMCIPYTHVEWS